ncbi:MAG TPA: PAS domain S-box protein [Candidatus Sulfomarinibacteraceae bacterium]|nr:PAS domain S-box protein [Candidatus Sulfomarinibacteraceae bacterium]
MSKSTISEEVILNRVTQIAATHHDPSSLHDALERFEARLDKLVGDETYVFWITEADGNSLLYISLKTEALFNQSRTVFYDDPSRFLQSIHPEDLPVLASGIAPPAEPLDLEFRIFLSNRSTGWVRARSFPIYDEKGRLYRLAGLAHDITAQKEEQLRLQENHQQYQSLFDHNPDSVYHFDLQGNFLSANSQLESLTGYTIDELMNMSFVPIVDPAHLQKTVEHFQRAAAGEPQNYDTVGVRKDGARFDANVTNIPIIVGDQVVGVYGIAKDITRRKQAARQQSAVVSLGQRALSGVPLATLLHEAVDHIARGLNVEFSHILQLDPQQDSFLLVEGAGWREDLIGNARIPTGTGSQAGYTLLANWDVHQDSARDDAGLHAGAPVVMSDAAAEARFTICDLLRRHEVASGLTVAIPGLQRPYGVLGAHSQSPRQFTDDDGQFLQVVANILGGAITRETLYRQLQAQTQQMQKIIDAVPEGLLLLDDQFRIRLTNPVARSLLPIINGSDADNALTHLGQTSMAVIATDVERNGTSIREIKVSAGDGSASERIFEVLTSIAAIDADETGWLLAIREVTEERLFQERIQLQERLAAVGQLAAGIAHDFNNILAVITLNTQLLQMTPNLPDGAPGRLQTILETSQHAARLITQILDFSRRSVMERKQFDLRSFVEETVELLRRTLAKTIAVEFMGTTGALHIRADRTRLQQVIMNMAFNARDAMPDGGRLTITLEHIVVRDDDSSDPELNPGRWALLTIADTGSGMTPEVMSRIYEPFFTTKGPKEGTGLGLAQAYGVVKQHGGHMTVTSRQGQGATFRVYLPLANETSPA